MPTSAAPELQFGVEIELMVRSRTKAHTAFSGIAAEIQSHLRDAGIPSKVADVTQMKAQDSETYAQWIIVEDFTLTSNERENKFGIELVSPIFPFRNHALWLPQIRTLFTVLHHHFHLSATPECSTHIHLSPTGGTPWTLSQAKSLASAVITFETAIDALVPAHRRSRAHLYCLSNRFNHGYDALPLPLVRASIARERSMRGLAGHMCWCAASSAKGQLLGRTRDFAHPHFRWNFLSLLTRKGTVEFRQPPGSRDAQDAVAWMVFAVCFARWAVGGHQAGNSSSVSAGGGEQGGGLGELCQNVWNSARSAGVGGELLAMLQGLFRGRGAGGVRS